jgi:hypothetical protein
MEIHMIRVENMNLCHQLAHVVLLEAVEKDGAVIPDGVAGNRIKQAVRIMDGSISNTLQSGVALLELEQWQVHTEHTTKVYEKGKKGRGHATYHPMLMNWATAFLACTSSSTYTKVAKIMCMLHVSTVYRKTAKLITTKNDKAYCLHMNPFIPSATVHIGRVGQVISKLVQLHKILPT